METVYCLGFKELVMIVCTSLIIIEQVFYWFLGSYPYRYGILIKTLPLIDLDFDCWNLVRKEQKKMSIKVNSAKKEIYLHHKYPIGIVGPLLFIGQIEYENSGHLKIRVGPISAVFIFLSLVLSLLTFNFYKLINIVVLLLFIYLLYLRFLKNFEDVKININAHQSENKDKS